MSEVKPDKTPSFLYDFGRFIPALDDIRVGMHELLNERDQLKAELAKLQSEREPRDNGDWTVTAMLPVTYPKGLDVVEGRKPGEEDAFVTDVRLILRPAPKPPEPVTWEAPALTDGLWKADIYEVENDVFGFPWGSLRGITKPAKLGKYVFKDGVGTLIEESK